MRSTVWCSDRDREEGAAPPPHHGHRAQGSSAAQRPAGEPGRQELSLLCIKEWGNDFAIKNPISRVASYNLLRRPLYDFVVIAPPVLRLWCAARLLAKVAATCRSTGAS